MKDEDPAPLKVDPIESRQNEPSVLGRREVLIGKRSWIRGGVGVACEFVAPVRSPAVLRRDAKGEAEEPRAHGSAGVEIAQVPMNLQKYVVGEVFDVGRRYAHPTQAAPYVSSVHRK